MLVVEITTMDAMVLQNIILDLQRKDPDDDYLKRLSAALSRAFAAGKY